MIGEGLDRTNHVRVAEQAIKENYSHVRYLEALLAMECEKRESARRVAEMPTEGSRLTATSPSQPGKLFPLLSPHIHLLFSMACGPESLFGDRVLWGGKSPRDRVEPKVRTD